MADAKGVRLPLAVAAAEGEAAFFYRGAQLVGRTNGNERGDGGRSVRRIGCEPRVIRGAADGGLAHRLVSAVARFERFDIDDVVELFGERVKVRDRRRRRNVAVVRVFFVAEKVEIRTAVR